MKEVAVRIAGNTLWLLLQRMGGRLLTFALMVYLARTLGSLGFGKLVFAISFTSLFLILSDLGITTLTIREVARDKEKGPGYVGSTATLKLLLSVFAFLVISIFLAVMKVPRDTRMVAYLIGACIILENMGGLFGAVFHAHENMKYVTISEVVQKVFLLSLCLALLSRGSGIISIGFAYLLSGVFFCIINIWFVHWKFMKPLYRIDTQFWKATLKESLPLAIVGVISMVYYNTDMVMLGKMKGEEVTGWYGVSYHLFFALATMPGAFLSAAFPVMSRFFKESEELLKKAYQKSFKVMLGAGIPVSVGTFLLSDKIILSLFGPQYHHSAAALKIFSFIIIFTYLNGLAGYFLTSINRQRLTAKILAVTTGINIVLNFILIPRYSYMGAVYATVVSEILFFIIFFLFLPRGFRPLPLGEIPKSVISSAIMGIVIKVMVLNGFILPVIIVAAIVIYAVSIWITGFLTRGEKAKLKSIFFRRKGDGGKV